MNSEYERIVKELALLVEVLKMLGKMIREISEFEELEGKSLEEALESIEMLNPSVKARINEIRLTIKNDPMPYKRFDF